MKKRGSKENKILITAIVILSLAIILSNLNILTGKAIYQNKPMKEGLISEQKEELPTTELTVSPNPVKAGKYITIKLTTGKTGADEKVTIYNEQGWRVVENLNLGCNGPKCVNETIIKVYPTSPVWKGEYSVIAKDYATPKGTEVVTYFEVI